MISEFVWLDIIDRHENVLCCSCSLPDPDPYSDEDMAVCGDITCTFDSQTDNATVDIKLFDNFKSLCIGDSFQRKDFVQAIIIFLNIKYGVRFQKININLQDCWGTYSGDLSSIDEVIRGID